MKPQCGLCFAIILALASKIQTDKFHSGQWINTDIVHPGQWINTDIVHPGHWINTDIAVNFELYVFEMIILREIQKCIESCKAKKQCKFINFDHRASLCYHIGSNSSVAFAREKKPGFHFGNKTEWNMIGYESCEECNNYGVCGLNDGGKYSKCQNSGCEPPENKTNAIFHGNMFSIGNRIEYECTEGYKTNKTVPLTSRCLENGTWSSVEVECLPGALFEKDGHRFENKFYKFSQETKNWTSAKEFCKQLPGDLVHIKSQTENEFIAAINENTYNYTRFWIGNKRGTNGEIAWLDESAFDNGYTNWYSKEPSGGNEDCVDIVKEFSYKWNDAPCHKKCYFICEFIET